MDKRLKEMTELTPENGYYQHDAVDGFNFAIQRLRGNKFFGHYSETIADWLELHLTQDVAEPTTTRLDGGK